MDFDVLILPQLFFSTAPPNPSGITGQGDPEIPTPKVISLNKVNIKKYLPHKFQCIIANQDASCSGFSTPEFLLMPGARARLLWLVAWCFIKIGFRSH